MCHVQSSPVESAVDRIYERRVEELLEEISLAKSGSQLSSASILPREPSTMRHFTSRALEEEFLQSKQPLNPHNIKHLDAFDHQLSKVAKRELDNTLLSYCDQIVEQILARCLIDSVLAIL